MKKESPENYFVIDEDALIEEALKVITLNKRGAVFVVDANRKVLGVASDGDIRRALVKGATLMAPIKKAMNPNLVFVRKNSEEDRHPETFFKTHPNITLLPVVTANFVLSHIYKSPGLQET